MSGLFLLTGPFRTLTGLPQVDRPLAVIWGPLSRILCSRTVSGPGDRGGFAGIVRPARGGRQVAAVARAATGRGPGLHDRNRAERPLRARDDPAHARTDRHAPGAA